MDETESEHAHSFPFLQIRKLGFKADLWEIMHSTLTSLIHNAQGVCTHISYSLAAIEGAGMTSPPRRASFVLRHCVWDSSPCYLPTWKLYNKCFPLEIKTLLGMKREEEKKKMKISC